jgi:hypothetical protein
MLTRLAPAVEDDGLQAHIESHPPSSRRRDASRTRSPDRGESQIEDATALSRTQKHRNRPTRERVSTCSTAR